MTKFLSKAIIIAAVMSAFTLAAFKANASQGHNHASMLQIQTVREVSYGVYHAHTTGGRFTVLAPPASDIAHLVNMDALSENWYCAFLPTRNADIHEVSFCDIKPHITLTPKTHTDPKL